MHLLNRWGLLVFIGGLVYLIYPLLVGNEFHIVRLIIVIIGAVFFMIPLRESDGPDSTLKRRW